MCDAERDWEWVKKKRWRLAAVRQDTGDLEDLQMTLGLTDDAGEELMEGVMLKEAKLFEVKEITSVPQRLLSQSDWEERESRFAFEILFVIDNNYEGAAVDRL